MRPLHESSRIRPLLTHPGSGTRFSIDRIRAILSVRILNITVDSSRTFRMTFLTCGRFEPGVLLTGGIEIHDRRFLNRLPPKRAEDQIFGPGIMSSGSDQL